MTYDIEAFRADIPADILAVLGDAETARSDPDRAERALHAALGVPEDWRRVGPDSARFGGFERPQRVYLKSLVALGYCRARLGDLEGGEAVLRKAASLDPGDRVGAARLAEVVARGGLDDEDEN